MKKTNEFLNGISFEDNMFVDETPAEVKLFDLEGNEVKTNEPE